MPVWNGLGIESRRILWLNLGRLAAATLLLGGSLALGFRGAHGDYTQRAILLLTVATFAVSLASTVWLRLGEGLFPLVVLSVGWDLVLVTGLVYLTGGLSSGFTSLYGVVILEMALVSGPRATQALSALAVVLVSAIGLSLASGWIDPAAGQPADEYLLPADDMAQALLRNVVGLILVGLLSSGLSARLFRAGDQLQAAEAEAEALRAKAERAERLAALGRLAASLAHEIRNPLSSISGSVEMVAEAQTLSEEDRRLLTLVTKEVERLDALVTTMLEVGIPRTPQKARVDVARLTQDVADVAAAQHPQVDLEVHAPEDGAFATVDPSQLRQLLWNLIKNAVQFSPPAGKVRVDIAQEEDRLRLAVGDQGEGVPDADRDRIFDMFFSRRTHGIGLGLALCRRIVDAHQGEVQVGESPLGGAEFVIHFPNSPASGPGP